MAGIPEPRRVRFLIGFMTCKALSRGMARPRTFDPDKVLDITLDVFWRKGSHGTSLGDITDESGLGKPSLYAAFGDKASLYLKVLDRYHSWLIKEAQRILSHGPSAREAVEAWLVSFVPRASGTKGKRGCLSLNTATDATLDQGRTAKPRR